MRSWAVVVRAQPGPVTALAASSASLSRTIKKKSSRADVAPYGTTDSSHAPRAGQSPAALSDPRRAYTINDTARILSVSRSTINKMIRLKLLKTIHLLGRHLVLRQSIEELLK
jgi:hypothetical protein